MYNINTNKHMLTTEPIPTNGIPLMYAYTHMMINTNKTIHHICNIRCCLKYTLLFDNFSFNDSIYFKGRFNFGGLLDRTSFLLK